MRIMLTGASGFIGSALVPRLQEQGHEVWQARRYHAGGFNFYDDPKIVLFDLRDSRETRDAVFKVKPDMIIHLGAVSAVSYSFLHPEEVNDVIYQGTIRLAEAAKEIGAHLVHASSSEVYGRGNYTYPITEDQPIGGTSPYAAGKVAAEEYLRIMANTYKTPITIMRPFNTIGRALINNRHYVVERAICQALETGLIKLHDPRPVRDFVWREDHVAGYLAVVANPEAAIGQTFNVCTGGGWSIKEMAEAVAARVRYISRWDVSVDFSQVPDRPLDILRLQGSNEKIRAVLGFHIENSIDQAITKATDEWYQVLLGTVKRPQV